jgi:hypothetical protein
MSGGINQIEFKILTLSACIGQAHALALDGNAPFPLNIHGVQNLIAEMPLINKPGVLNEPIRQGRFTVVDMGNDTEISDMKHSSLY